MSQPVIIRPASPEDAKALLQIYAPYVKDTAISFEYTVPSIEEFAERIRKTLALYPYLVALHNGEIVGYAYASAFKNRAAYARSVESSIYIAQTCRGGGIGRALYDKLEAVLRHQNILNLNACIALPTGEDVHLTTDSPKFHERLGYRTVAHFHKCAFKFNTWYDMIWMEKLLGEHLPEPEPVRPFLEVWRDYFA
ncbi:GNAT family N-acetyltransferase [Oscillospiraceae bacterium LTW-04]|nr:N-acetyltransferase family protein [Oscillospiraceae bacterium MB24-C1]